MVACRFKQKVSSTDYGFLPKGAWLGSERDTLAKKLSEHLMFPIGLCLNELIRPLSAMHSKCELYHISYDIRLQCWT